MQQHTLYLHGHVVILGLGQAAAPRSWGEWKEYNSQADEDYSRNWLQSGRVPTIPTRCLQQHNSKFDGYHQSHGSAQNRF